MIALLVYAFTMEGECALECILKVVLVYHQVRLLRVAKVYAVENKFAKTDCAITREIPD